MEGKLGEEKAFPPPTPPLLSVGWPLPRGEYRPGKIEEGSGENTFSPALLLHGNPQPVGPLIGIRFSVGGALAGRGSVTRSTPLSKLAATLPGSGAKGSRRLRWKLPKLRSCTCRPRSSVVFSAFFSPRSVSVSPSRAR